MKKILSLTLILIMILCLSACRKTGSSSTDVESDLLTSTNESIAESKNSESQPEGNEEESSWQSGDGSVIDTMRQEILPLAQ